MNKFIDFAPKRPQSVVESHPVVKKPATSSKPQNQANTLRVSHKPRVVARKPQVSSRGIRMDFVRRPTTTPMPQVKVKKTIQVSIGSKSTSKSSSKPTSSTTPKPATRPSLKTATSHAPRRTIESVSRPNTRPASRPVRVVRPDSRPTSRPEPRPEPDLESQLESDLKLESNFDEELLDDEPILEDDELSLALAGFADDEESPSLIDKLSKEANDFEDELNALDELDEISDDIEAEIEDFVEEPKPIFKESKKLDAPDANKFSLGGRSPFLSSVRVEKRPLSGIASEEVKPLKSETKTPIKNAYRAKIKQVFKDDNKGKTSRRETTIISTPEPRGHTIGLAIAITLTVILGALIGSVIYLVFFQ